MYILWWLYDKFVANPIKYPTESNTILITGGGGTGLGFETAKLLVSHHNVYVTCAHSIDVMRLRGTGIKVVLDPDTFKEHIDIVILNSAILSDSFDDMFRTNFRENVNLYMSIANRQAIPPRLIVIHDSGIPLVYRNMFKYYFESKVLLSNFAKSVGGYIFTPMFLMRSGLYRRYELLRWISGIFGIHPKYMAKWLVDLVNSISQTP